MSGAWRQRVASSLNTRTAAGLEVLLVLTITLGLRFFRWLPIDETLPILGLGWLSLWLRGKGWRSVGLTRPERWGPAILVGIAVGVGLQALSEFVTEPLITRLTGVPIDVSEFRPLVGNVKLCLLYFVLVWTLAAFGEELTYRGYVLNRGADLGGRTTPAWAGSLVLMTALHSYGHSYQGLSGALDTGIHGLALGVVYLACRKNLWPAIFAHGVNDTVALCMAFLGHF